MRAVTRLVSGIAFVVLLSCVACSGRRELSELEFNGESHYVYHNGKVFSGEAWSSDGRTLCVICSNGVIESVVAYHDNGKKAIETHTLLGEGTFYDCSGNTIEPEVFIERYPALAEQIAAMSYELKGI